MTKTITKAIRRAAKKAAKKPAKKGNRRTERVLSSIKKNKTLSSNDAGAVAQYKKNKAAGKKVAAERSADTPKVVITVREFAAIPPISPAPRDLLGDTPKPRRDLLGDERKEEFDGVLLKEYLKELMDGTQEHHLIWKAAEKSGFNVRALDAVYTIAGSENYTIEDKRAIIAYLAVTLRP